MANSYWQNRRKPVTQS